MKRLFYLPALAFGLSLAPGAHAQPVPIDLDRLDALFDVEPTVEVNLRGSLLRLAAEASRGDEPDVATMIDGLRGITVRIYPLTDRLAEIGDRMADIGRRFESDGWSTLVRVRGRAADNEDVWIYVRDGEDTFNGMVVMTIDPDEEQAVFVLMDGLIDPADVGRLSRRFGNVQVDVDDFDVDLDSLDEELEDLDDMDIDIDVDVEMDDFDMDVDSAKDVENR